MRPPTARRVVVAVRTLPPLAEGTTLYGFAQQAHAAPRIPVFSEVWYVNSAIGMTRGDRTLRASPIRAVLRCAPEGADTLLQVPEGGRLDAAGTAPVRYVPYLGPTRRGLRADRADRRPHEGLVGAARCGRLPASRPAGATRSSRRAQSSRVPESMTRLGTPGRETAARFPGCRPFRRAAPRGRRHLSPDRPRGPAPRPACARRRRPGLRRAAAAAGPALRGRAPRRAAARDRRPVPRRARARGITFDDDLVEHMWVAAPRLRAQGLPATLFLCGASLERPHPFWWEGLELARERGLDPAALLPAELGAAPGEPLEALAAQRKDFDPALRPAGRGGARGRARAARRSPGAEESRAWPARSTSAFTRCAIPTRHDSTTPRSSGGSRRAARRWRRQPGARCARSPIPTGIDERVGAAPRHADFELGCSAKSRSAAGGPLAMGRVEAGPVPLAGFAGRVERALRRP